MSQARKTPRSNAATHVPREVAMRFLPLSEPMFLILLTLSRAELHGYGILQAIKAGSAGSKTLRTGTLYNALARLQRQALIGESPEAKPKANVAAPQNEARGRTYQITELGSAVFKAESERLAGLLEMAGVLTQS